MLDIDARALSSPLHSPQTCFKKFDNAETRSAVVHHYPGLLLSLLLLAPKGHRETEGRAAARASAAVFIHALYALKCGEQSATAASLHRREARRSCEHGCGEAAVVLADDAAVVDADILKVRSCLPVIYADERAEHYSCDVTQ